MNRIITIGREFGSGGREFGRRLAETLGIQYYDREIISDIAGHASLSEEYVREVVENQPQTLYPITIGHSFDVMETSSFQQVQSVYQAQRDTILGLADKSDCVIIGRCADFILRDLHPFRLFVYADMDSRVRRCFDRSPEGEQLSEKQMIHRIRTLDKKRAHYYEFYTGRRWGERENYDMLVNTTDADIPTLVSVISKLF